MREPPFGAATDSPRLPLVAHGITSFELTEVVSTGSLPGA
jgi:hypothetical protein